MSRRWRTLILACMAMALLPAVASASWHATSSNGKGYSVSKSLSAGNTPTASVSNRSVTVSWTAPGGGAPASGYVVKRYNTGGALQTIGAGCSGTVAGTSCTETSVPAGSWKYSVTPANANWRGAESAQSTAATVGSPTLTVSPTNITSLPQTLTGSIANFIPGQTVTYRLDDPTTGTVLTGSITPSPVQASGAATVSVTIPAGTANGAHTVYAIGSGSDTASASITVAVPTTITTSAWDLRDASSGAEVNVSDPYAFASDSRTHTTSLAPLAFATTKYLDFDYNAPLGSFQTPSGVNFNFRFADATGVDSACFYFDVIRRSTSTTLATHGSSASPVACTSSTTQATTTTALPEVTSAAIADDLRIRVYVRDSASAAFPVDMATVTGTGSGTPFTLFSDSTTDRANGTAVTTPWSLSTTDATRYTSANAWAAAFSTTKYLKLTFPAYVPASAAISSVTFNNVFRTATAPDSLCYYMETVVSGTVIGTHGSTTTPQSCSTSATADVTDAISLPEVNTATKANGLVLKLYVRSSNLRKSLTDKGTVSITYVP